MKKLLCILSVMVLIFSMVSCQTYSGQEQSEYFNEINNLIKDREFNTAKLEDSKIVLYDRDQEVIDKIEFDGYRGKMGLMYIRRTNTKLFFVTGASIDDDSGIVFINDESDSAMDGVYALERVPGHFGYKYRTYP